MTTPRRFWPSQPPFAVGANTALLGSDAILWSASGPHALYRGTSQVATMAAEGGTITRQARRLGIVRYWSRVTAAGVDFGEFQPLTSSVGLTVLVIAQPVASTNRKCLMSQRGSGNAVMQLIANANSAGSASSGDMTLRLVSSAGTNCSVAATGTVDGDMHCWVFSNGAVSGEGYAFRDGVDLGASTSAAMSGTFTATSQNFRIGNLGDAPDTSHATDDPLVLVIAWPRRLPPELAQRLATQFSRGIGEAFAPMRQRMFAPAASGTTDAAISTASGAATASTLAGASTAASAAAQAAGAATASTLGGSSVAVASFAAAAGAAAASTATGASIATSTPNAAAGSATASSIAGASTAAAAITAADGVATAGTLTGVAGSGSTIGTAAGVATAAALAGSSIAAASFSAAAGAATASAGGASTAAAAITAAVGAASAQTLTGSGATGGSDIGVAAGAATCSTLAGSSVVAASFGAAAGAASAQIVVGASFAAASIGAAAGASTCATLSPVFEGGPAPAERQWLIPGIDRVWNIPRN